MDVIFLFIKCFCYCIIYVILDQLFSDKVLKYNYKVGKDNDNNVYKLKLEMYKKYEGVTLFYKTNSLVFLSCFKKGNDYYLDTFVNGMLHMDQENINKLKFYYIVLKFLEMDIIKYINNFDINHDSYFENISDNLGLFNYKLQYSDINKDNFNVDDCITYLIDKSKWSEALSKMVTWKIMFLYKFNKRAYPKIKEFCEKEISNIMHICELRDYAQDKNKVNDFDKMILERPFPLIICTKNIIDRDAIKIGSDGMNIIYVNSYDDLVKLEHILKVLGIVNVNISVDKYIFKIFEKISIK